MPKEAFVCPHCRTWVEGEGRSIRCPACGKRFRADEARLAQVHAAAALEAMDYEVPETTGWETIEDARREPPPFEAPEFREPAPRPEPEVRGWDTPEPDYEAPDLESERARHEWVTPSSNETPAAGSIPGEDSPEESSQTVPWRWIIGIAVLLLFFVGGRFLSGEIFIVAFMALIAAQWLLDRGKDKT